MRTSTWIATTAGAFVAGVLLVVACGDDSPGDADAATCDCPAAEPPLAGRITVVHGTRLIPANGADLAEAVCPMGATLLGGGCRLAVPDSVFLEEAGPNRDAPAQPAYWCQWKSGSTHRHWWLPAHCWPVKRPD